MNFQPSQRHLPLDGTYNVRDLGGYPTNDGHTTRWHTFLRADALHRLSPLGQQACLDLGIRTVIDLRFPSEVQTEPNVFVGQNQITYYHISLLGASSDRQASAEKQAAAHPSLEAVYRAILDRRQLTLRSIFEVMSAETQGAILFHCTAGKDRTGLVAALLLGLAGVDAAVIAEDYALTAQYLGDLKETFRAKALASGQDMTVYEQMWAAKPEAMLNTLAYLEEKYGGVHAYLRRIGLSKRQLDQLRHQLIGADADA